MNLAGYRGVRGARTEALRRSARRAAIDIPDHGATTGRTARSRGTTRMGAGRGIFESCSRISRTRTLCTAPRCAKALHRDRTALPQTGGSREARADQEEPNAGWGLNCARRRHASCAEPRGGMETNMDRRTVMVGFAIAGSGVLTATAAQLGAESPLIAAFAKTLSGHDIDGFAALFAEDYVNHQMSAAAPKPAPDEPQSASSARGSKGCPTFQSH
jgi:hypothetical protein